MQSDNLYHELGYALAHSMQFQSHQNSKSSLHGTIKGVMTPCDGARKRHIHVSAHKNPMENAIFQSVLSVAPARHVTDVV